MIRQTVIGHVLLPVLEWVSRTRFWSLTRSAWQLQQTDSNSQWVHQRAQMVRLLQHAAQQTHYWPAVLNQAAIQATELDIETVSSAWRRLPVSSKQTYSSGFPDQVTDYRSRDSFQYLSSSGTTGRMTVVTDFRKRDYLRAAEHLMLRQALRRPLPPATLDIPPNACNVVCGLADPGPEGLWSYLRWAARRKTLWSPEARSDIKGRFERQVLFRRHVVAPLTPGPWDSLCEQIDALLEQLAARRIEVLRGLPHFLLWIAERAAQRDVKLPDLRIVIPYGGLAGDAMVARIEQNLRVQFVNAYGTGEVGSVACSQPRTDGDILHLFTGMFFAEVLDEFDEPVAEGGVGRLVLTDLQNLAMPIVRYQVGDMAQVIRRCGIGCTQFRLLGRCQETLRNAQGELITARDLQNAFFQYAGVINFRVDQVTAKVFKAAVVTSGPTRLATLAETLKELLGSGVAVNLKEQPFLLPETSGKYLALKTKVSPTAKDSFTACSIAKP